MEFLNVFYIRKFLELQGDTNISFSEWELMNESPIEDLCNLKYSYSRRVDYFHPRSDPMINFMGPKQAPAQQSQYLYVRKPSHGKDVSSISYHSGIILTVTQFSQIPMADVFKVLQYWSFEACKSHSKNYSCIVRMYVAIHYNKYTMLKSSILSGAKDDLQILVKKWTLYIADVVKVAISSKQSRKSNNKEITNSPLLDDETCNSQILFDNLVDRLAETNKKIVHLESAMKSEFEATNKLSNSLCVIIYLLLGIVILQLFLSLWSR